MRLLAEASTTLAGSRRGNGFDRPYNNGSSSERLAIFCVAPASPALGRAEYPVTAFLGWLARVGLGGWAHPAPTSGPGPCSFPEGA